MIGASEALDDLQEIDAVFLTDPPGMNARATKRRPINGAKPQSKAGFIQRRLVGRPLMAAGFVDQIAPIQRYPNNSLISSITPIA
jgi:hypothetical protein